MFPMIRIVGIGDILQFITYIADAAEQHIVLRQDCNDMIVHNGNDMYVVLTPSCRCPRASQVSQHVVYLCQHL